MSSERRPSDTRNIVSGLYTLGVTIGTGHFAVVKLARHVFTQKEVAVKVIDKMKLDQESKTHLFQEVTCMKLVQHPNVVRLYEVIDTPNKLYLIMELADGGDMFDYLLKYANGLSEISARRYFRQICRALKYCHEMHVCHRDLKPENLVFFEKQGVVKLTDFGFSNQFFPGKKLLTSCGSLAYSAPEILLGDPYDAIAVDIWSLGVVLFMLVTGRAPFQEANDSETIMMILDCCYKLPGSVSSECQNLIHRMIVREPEQRATLDEVMSDTWYRQYDDDDDVELSRSISTADHESILYQMINGNIAEREAITKALNEDEYNHITATYYLLAEKIFHEKIDDHNQNTKRQRRSLQPASDPFTEQIGVFISSSNSGKENIPPMLPIPRHSIDSSNEQSLSALVEDDEERPSLQQRGVLINTQAPSAQAMNIIPEEDESPESPSADKTGLTIQQLANLPKLNKIVENEDADDKPPTPNATILTDSSTTTGGILRSKDLRSAVETKRRNFSRSCSSSDSEDNGSNHDMTRLTNRKRTRSPSSLHESEFIINNRGRSFSNIEHVLHETPTNIQQQMTLINSSEHNKRRSSSRAGSIISANRLTSNFPNDNINTDTSHTNSSTLIYERMRSLSVDHRLANPSQMSIASRTSIRYTTPRESTVFTKTDAPTVVRILQQAHHQDTTDAILTLIEHQRSQQTPSLSEHNSTPIIGEEDVMLLSNTNVKKISNGVTKSNVITSTGERVSVGNGHVLSPQHTVLSTSTDSLLNHQQQRKSSEKKSSNKKKKQNRSTNIRRACCTIS